MTMKSSISDFFFPVALKISPRKVFFNKFWLILFSFTWNLYKNYKIYYKHYHLCL